MSQGAGQLQVVVNNNRTRLLVVPREHGAWGILLVPLFTGACIGASRGGGLRDLTLFLAAALAMFWMRTPLESWLGTSPMKAHTAAERKSVMLATLGIGAIAAVSLGLLLWGGRNPGLVLIGALACAAFAIQAVIKRFGRTMRMPAQIIGAIGLTSTAAGAYYVVTGHLDVRAYGIWAANWIFAADQIHFVQIRLHNSRVSGVGQRLLSGRYFFIGQVVMLAVVALASKLGVVPSVALLAFVPVVTRGVAWFFEKPAPLELHWIGITELVQSITFGAILICTYYF